MVLTTEHKIQGARLDLDQLLPHCIYLNPEPYRDRVATTEVQNAWSSRDSRRLQIVPGSALAGNSNCKNRVTELRFLVISRQ